jgi:hypothetical protein
MHRDQSDSTRRDGPLVVPDGADVLDTSDIDIDDVIDRLEDIVRLRASAALARDGGDELMNDPSDDPTDRDADDDDRDLRVARR